MPRSGTLIPSFRSGSFALEEARFPAKPGLRHEGTVSERRVSDVVILIPVYRDWHSASIVCQLLESELKGLPQVHARIVLVDDGGADGHQGWVDFEALGAVRKDTLRLARNVGHQRAICLGLSYVHEHIPCDFVLVMDADGEDSPDDASRLIEKIRVQNCNVVFAERRRRVESVRFRVGYFLFRKLHWALTGQSVRFGNFSVISRNTLSHLVCMPELWSHYAGAVVKSKIPFECVPMDRGPRLKGITSMTFPSLIVHGIAAIATFQETVACRILIFNGIGLGLLLMLLAVIVGIKVFSGLAIPGWTTSAVGLTAVLFTQLLAISFSLVFSLISSRSTATFLPKRDYHFYIGSFGPLETRNGA